MASRRHATKVMISGASGVGPGGMPMKIHWSWVSEIETAAKKSKYHERGANYRVSTTMDAEYFKKELRIIGKKIRAEYAKLGKSTRRVKLQIDSAGGHGMARGHGNYEELKAMMDRDFNIDLVQQVGNTPAFNIMRSGSRQDSAGSSLSRGRAVQGLRESVEKSPPAQDPHRVRDAQGLRARVHCDWWGH